MAYDEALAQRIREALDGEPGLTEKGMFGGHAFMIAGNMAVSASGQGGLLLRIDPADAQRLTGDPRATRFEMRGRAMSGWLHVEVDAGVPEAEFQRWVDIGAAYARSLPPK